MERKTIEKLNLTKWWEICMLLSILLFIWDIHARERQVMLVVYAACHANPERNMLNFRDVLFFSRPIWACVYQLTDLIPLVFILHLIPLKRFSSLICVYEMFIYDLRSFPSASGIKSKPYKTVCTRSILLFSQNQIYTSSLVRTMIDWYTIISFSSSLTKQSSFSLLSHSDSYCKDTTRIDEKKTQTRYYYILHMMTMM